MLTASPFILFTGIVLPEHPDTVGIVAVLVTFVLLITAGVTCWRRPTFFPDSFWVVVPFIATAVIAALNVISSDASTGAQLFLLWPVLYAATFLSRRAIACVLLAVLAAEAAVVFPVLTTGGAIADTAAMMIALSMSAVVVVTLRERRDQLLSVLETQALADPLTGLPNRRSFDRDLAHAEAWVRRSGGPLSLLTVDLDHFKAINDTWGHAIGDLALQAVATAMRSAVRETDVVARLGGDEFVILLRCDRRGALRVAAALRELLAACEDLPGGPPRLSIGLAVLPDDATDVEALLAASDAALYDAKMSGRDRVASVRPTTDTADPVEQQIADPLPTAGRT
jgi:diguanylate cyclase (GGDEF)-like protein